MAYMIPSSYSNPFLISRNFGLVDLAMGAELITSSELFLEHSLVTGGLTWRKALHLIFTGKSCVHGQTQDGFNMSCSVRDSI